MSLSKFDPWSVIERAGGSAYRAYSAYPPLHLGTLGTIGTGRGRGLSVDDFEERSAVIEICSVVGRAVARKQAAAEFGFSSVGKLHEAAVASWRNRFLAAPCSDARAGTLVQQAMALCDGPWIHRLVALDWDEISLFAVNIQAPLNGGGVQAAKTGNIVAATAGAIYFTSRHTQVRTYRRFDAVGEECSLIWDV